MFYRNLKVYPRVGGYAYGLDNKFTLRSRWASTKCLPFLGSRKGIDMHKQCSDLHTGTNDASWILVTMKRNKKEEKFKGSLLGDSVLVTINHFLFYFLCKYGIHSRKEITHNTRYIYYASQVKLHLQKEKKKKKMFKLRKTTNNDTENNHTSSHTWMVAAKSHWLPKQRL